MAQNLSQHDEESWKPVIVLMSDGKGWRWATGGGVLKDEEILLAIESFKFNLLQRMNPPPEAHGIELAHGRRLPRR
jgi:hypothetical protein